MIESIKVLFKNLFLFSSFFLITYFESASFGNLKIGHIIKFILFVFLIGYIIYYSLNRYKTKLPSFVILKYFYGIKNMFTFTLFDYPFTVSLSQSIRYSFFSLFYHSICRYFQSVGKLYFFGLRVSQFLILFNVPFLMGILTQRREEIVFSSDVNLFCGIFQNPHACSIITSGAAIFILFHIFDQRKRDLSWFYNLFLYLLAAYIVYRAFVRTGWILFLVGSVITLLGKGLSKKNIFLLLLFLLLGGVVYTIFLSENITFMDRVFDVRNNRQTDYGSGRLLFAKAAINCWTESDLFVKFFGAGEEYLKDYMASSIGMRIFAHNGFVNAFVTNGIIGFFIFLLAMFCLFKNVLSCRKSIYFPLCMALTCGYFLFELTQGGFMFTFDLIYATALVLLNKDSDSLNQIV